MGNAHGRWFRLVVAACVSCNQVAAAELLSVAQVLSEVPNCNASPKPLSAAPSL